jgi:hypothetical protein
VVSLGRTVDMYIVSPNSQQLKYMHLTLNRGVCFVREAISGTFIRLYTIMMMYVIVKISH